MIKCEINEKTMQKTVELKGSGNVILNEFAALTGSIYSMLAGAGMGSEETASVIAKAVTDGIAKTLIKKEGKSNEQFI